MLVHVRTYMLYSSCGSNPGVIELFLITLIMAQLPPKIPNIIVPNHHHHHPNPNSHQWPEFKHEHEPDQNNNNNPSWVDEFMEFSAAKRGAHRRTMSDSSVTFLEAGPVPTFLGGALHGPDTQQRRSHNDRHDEENEQFEKFDDEQFMSMFSNELGSCSNPSSTSDHNSTNEDQKGAAAGEMANGEEREKREERERAEEVESKQQGGGGSGGGGNLKAEQGQQAVVNEGAKSGGNAGGANGANNSNAGGGDQQIVADPKRVKRILANRQSAQRSRVRKLQYISELERSVTALQSEVSMLSPRVAFLDQQRMILNLDNSALKAKLAALAQDKIFKDAHQEALKREIERLRQVFYQQNLKNDGTMTPQSSSPLPSPGVQPPRSDIRDNDNEQPTVS